MPQRRSYRYQVTEVPREEGASTCEKASQRTGSLFCCVSQGRRPGNRTRRLVITSSGVRTDRRESIASSADVHAARSQDETVCARLSTSGLAYRASQSRSSVPSASVAVLIRSGPTGKPSAETRLYLRSEPSPGHAVPLALRVPYPRADRANGTGRLAASGDEPDVCAGEACLPSVLVALDRATTRLPRVGRQTPHFRGVPKQRPPEGGRLSSSVPTRDQIA